MKKAIVFLLIINFGLSARAQFNPEARTYIDKAVGILFGDAVHEMSYTLMADGGASFTSEGKILLKDSKYRVENDVFHIYNNGVTQWVYSVEDKELTIQEVDTTQLDEADPLLILRDYKSGYKFDIHQESKDEINVYLIPNKENSPYLLVSIVIDKANYYIKTIHLKLKDESSLEIKLRNIRKLVENNTSIFEFKKDIYQIDTETDLRF